MNLDIVKSREFWKGTFFGIIAFKAIELIFSIIILIVVFLFA